jgi:hypothetical protein
MPGPECQSCGRRVRRVVYVQVAESAGGAAAGDEYGPYGRDCARDVVEALLRLGIASRRRYERV